MSPAQASPLIPRAKLFGNPVRAQARISPDGRHLSWLAPWDGVLNVFVAPLNDMPSARRVTADRKRGVLHHIWTYDGRTLLYQQNDNGDENFVWSAVDATTGDVRALTPLEGVQSRFAGLSRDEPKCVAIAMNDRDPRWRDYWRIDSTRRMTLRVLC